MLILLKTFVIHPLQESNRKLAALCDDVINRRKHTKIENDEKLNEILKDTNQIN